MSGNVIIFIVIGIMLFVAVTAALIWWHLADIMYPGTDRKTGQRIFKKRGRQVNSSATVVTGFDSPVASSNAEPPPPHDRKPGG